MQQIQLLHMDAVTVRLSFFLSAAFINPAGQGQKQKGVHVFRLHAQAAAAHPTTERRNKYVWNNAWLWVSTTHTFPPY